MTIRKRPATQSVIKDRVRELRRIRAGDLVPNPSNWRRHPQIQVEAMRGILEEIGFADALLAYETPDGPMLVDGHLRAGLDPEQVVPVLILDITEEEAKKMLATLDPLASMAEPDKDILASLLESIHFEAPAVNDMLDLMKPFVRPEGIAWDVDRLTIQGTAQETAGYDLSSVWDRTGREDARLTPYLMQLPVQPRTQGPDFYGVYSRSPAMEMEHIVRTYMRPGDYFLEVCAGWWTFSATAAVWGYNGEGLDIWDVSLKFGHQQLGKLPIGAGRVKVVEGDAMAMPYQDDTFDFLYCNPPFHQLERYSTDERDLSSHNTVESWLEHSGLMMAEMRRVTKPGGLIVTVMADSRVNGVLIDLHSAWIKKASDMGLILHDLAVQHLISQQLRIWRHAYKDRRTAKAHEYIIVFKVPGETEQHRPASGTD